MPYFINIHAMRVSDGKEREKEHKHIQRTNS